MISRTRLAVWLGGVALLAVAIVMLRAVGSDPGPDVNGPLPTTRLAPYPFERFATDDVVLPEPAGLPEPPGQVTVSPEPGRLRLAWADGVSGGRAPNGASGYEVRWRRATEDAGADRVRLITEPAVQLDGLDDSASYRVEVRTVDAFGQRSEPVATTAASADGDQSWRDGLTGMLEDFSDPVAVQQENPASRWHLSGYRGCVGVEQGRRERRGQLAVDLGCGADDVVLRARRPFQVGDVADGRAEFGRVALVTDAAGPRGELTIDLVPGAADRVGARGAGRATGAPADRADVEPTLPSGTIRVSISDSGVRVTTGADVPRSTADQLWVAPAPRRGTGVLHRFEVVLSASGLRVLQDGQLVGTGDVLPAWREAYVLFGMSGPPGRRSRVHLDAAGFSGMTLPGQQPVVESTVVLATQRVLGADEPAPGAGISRSPLVNAASARLRATVTVVEGFDPRRMSLQIGDRTIDARLATAGPAVQPGALVTVVADLPRDLLGTQGPSAVSPLVLRGHGQTPVGAAVVESYLEITPEVVREPVPTSTRADSGLGRMPPALPVIAVRLKDTAGTDLVHVSVPPQALLVLDVALDGTAAQWDAGGLAGVRGFQVLMDNRLLATVPTSLHGPGLGGRYTLSVSLRGVSRGPHTLEVKQQPADSDREPISVLVNFTVR